MTTTFKQVSREEFFARINPMNVHPRSEPDCSIWETPAREVVGKTVPGYRNGWTANGKTPSAYFLVSRGD